MNNCMYFGVRTDERKESKECEKCKEVNPEIFKTCGVETNRFFATSIDVVNGKTVKVMGPLSCMRAEPNLSNSPKAKQIVKTSVRKENSMAKREVNMKKVCRDLIKNGKGDEEIVATLAVIYEKKLGNAEAATKKAKSYLQTVQRDLAAGKKSETTAEDQTN